MMIRRLPPFHRYTFQGTRGKRQWFMTSINGTNGKNWKDARDDMFSVGTFLLSIHLHHTPELTVIYDIDKYRPFRLPLRTNADFTKKAYKIPGTAKLLINA